jgi:transcriptional regulator with XRE-family HTH domain
MNDLKAKLKELGLTQAKLAEMCGVHIRTAQRWCSGEVEMPKYAKIILEQSISK